MITLFDAVTFNLKNFFFFLKKIETVENLHYYAIPSKMDSFQRQVLMERRSLLPENICPETGMPLRPPELLRCRQIGLSVSNTVEFVEWIQNTVEAYKWHYTSPDRTSIMLVCEVEMEDPYYDESFRLVESSNEKWTDTLLAESAHCAYSKVWRITALYDKQTQSSAEAMIREPSVCQRFLSLLRCERENLKVYFIDILH